jgi:hypothetical protein
MFLHVTCSKLSSGFWCDLGLALTADGYNESPPNTSTLHHDYTELFPLPYFKTSLEHVSSTVSFQTPVANQCTINSCLVGRLRTVNAWPALKIFHNRRKTYSQKKITMYFIKSQWGLNPLWNSDVTAQPHRNLTPKNLGPWVLGMQMNL